jgi:hypothetical protein
MCNDGEYSTDLSDGLTTETIPNNPNTNSSDFGQHENLKWYSECTTRYRNQGLYTADQIFGTTRETAKHTRQNNAGNRYGLECPEERDYYPYWHPTPWRDISVCTDTPSQCPYYQGQSQNVLNKGICSIPIYNNQNICQKNKGVWTEKGAWNTAAPNCTTCPTTR